MNLPHAVIIAGGHGQRLGGVRKADIRIGGVRLIERVARALGGVAGPLLISTGPGDSRIALPKGAIAVPDLDIACAGPLAGLLAGVAALQNLGVSEGLLISVAVDTPFLPANFVARMAENLVGAPASFAAWGDDFYPPNAAWRLEVLADLSHRIASDDGPRSLKALQGELGARRVDWYAPDTANPFANLNTLKNLVELGTRALP